jgi:hypothetical protein
MLSIFFVCFLCLYVNMSIKCGIKHSTTLSFTFFGVFLTLRLVYTAVIVWTRNEDFRFKISGFIDLLVLKVVFTLVFL